MTNALAPSHESSHETAPATLGSREKPGPIATTAPLRSGAHRARAAALAAPPPNPANTAPGALAAKAGTSASGTNAETRPAPPLRAPITASIAAPG